MDISVSVDISGAIRQLDDLARKQMPFAMSRTINSLLHESAKKALPDEANRVFEGGATPFTKRGFKYAKATKKRLVGWVFIDERTHGYLVYQIKGGTRGPSARKIIVPTSNARLNKYGNLSKAQRERLFSNRKFFTGAPSTTVGLGVWERYGRKQSKLRKVASLVNKATYTNPKLDMYGVVKAVVTKSLNTYFNRNLALAMRTAR